jgi:putative ABC transport system permease protein
VTFILNLTWREVRSSWRRLLFFFLCLSIGVGSIVALRSLVQNLNRAVSGDARNLLTADIEINTTSPLTPAQTSAIENVTQNYPVIEDRTETIQTNTMARSSDPARETSSMIELKGIEPNFPLVGNFLFSDKTPFNYNSLKNHGALAAPVLLDKLGIKLGDKIRIGDAEFQIRGTFDDEPGGTGGFRMGPRVFVERKAFDEAGLTGAGSRARRKILLRTATDPQELTKGLREALKGSVITVQSYREAQENFGEQFERMENYLSLCGLLILVLGGVGVWNVARVFVEQKRQTIAVLKCLGARGKRIIFIYLAQIFLLGLMGSLFGVLLAQAALLGVRQSFTESLPANLNYQLSFSSVWQGITLGIIISLLFSALPLSQIDKIKPRLLLRDENNERLRRLDPAKWFFGFLVLGGIILLSVWQANSWRVGLAFVGGLAATSLVLFFSAWLLTLILKRARKFGSFAVSQAINSLHRPGNQTRVILLAVGLGTFVVLAVQSLQVNLVRQFDFSRNSNLPALFLTDIQRSQKDGVAEILRQQTGEEAEMIPTVRGRIAAIDGQPVDFGTREVRRESGQLGREFIFTYRPNLDVNEKIIDGKFWDPAPVVSDEEAEVSIGDSMQGVMGMDIGSLVTFDILGRRLTARVTSVREFDAQRTRTAFMFVFRPGVLENAPQTFVSPVTKKMSGAERGRIQYLILEKFPSVSVIDVVDVLTAVQKLLANFTLAVSAIGIFVVISGLLILLGSVALTKSQRIYENAVLKTLGATRRTLAVILFTEYGLIGFLSGIIGAGFALLLSWAVTKYIFAIDWEIDWNLIVFGVLIETILVMLIGAASSFDVLFRKPLGILRNP